MSVSKKQILDKLSYRKLRLYSDYHIVNSNYIFGQGILPYLGHEYYCRQLETLMANSDGGAILVTGFRGVGKSTLVHNAVVSLNKSSLYKIIPISIVLPAEKKYGQVLVEVIRKLYETLSHDLLWNELKHETQERIRLAYNRTVLNIKRSRNLSIEGELSMQIPLGWSSTAKTRENRQQSEEDNYLIFSEQDAEYELTQCIEALNDKEKVVIIIDEIDKMTASQEGMLCFDNLLERMKNLISSTNALFVFVAGIDIYKRWESNSQKVNSLYDSLFGHHIYLPCIWDSVTELFTVIEDKEYVYKPVEHEFKELVQMKYTSILEKSFQMLESYLLFKGKGLPRKILATFNDFIIWDGQQPCFLLTENRIQAILLADKLLDKFHIYVSSAKITTIYERDICYTLFFSMLEFLLFQEDTEFTKEQLRNTILDERSSMQQYFEELLNNLLRDFTELSFIKKTETGYEIIDDTILKKDQSLRILDQDLLLRAQSKEQLPNRKDTSVDDRFHDQIKLIQDENLTTFWTDYKAEQVIADSKQMMIFRVVSYNSGLLRYAVIYKGNYQADIDTDTEHRTMSGNLYLLSPYQFNGPYFLDTEDYIRCGTPVTSLRTAVNGYSLAHLIEAKLCNRTIYQIIRQVISMVEYLHSMGFGNVKLKPDNIMVCKNTAIKVLDLKHICRLGSSASCLTRIYSAPEMYLSECSAATDYYSVGILLAEMVTGKSLSRYYAERHIDINSIMMNVSCSQRLKDILVKATSFDPEKRYEHGSDLLKALDKCSEFRGFKRIPMPKTGNGTVTGHNVKETMSIVPIQDSKNDASETIKSDSTQKNKTIDLGIPSKNLNMTPVNNEITEILGSVYFDNNMMLQKRSKKTAAYLVRLSNNERIVLNKPAFKIGRDKMRVDYCLDNISVSQRHTELVQSIDGFYIRDLNSTNGTFLNAKRIMPDTVRKIVHGDQIRIANEEFVFNEQ